MFGGASAAYIAPPRERPTTPGALLDEELRQLRERNDRLQQQVTELEREVERLRREERLR